MIEMKIGLFNGVEDVNNKYLALVPERLIIGETEEDCNRFFDSLSNEIYEIYETKEQSLEFPGEIITKVVSIKELAKKYKISMEHAYLDIESLLIKYFEEERFKIKLIDLENIKEYIEIDESEYYNNPKNAGKHFLDEEELDKLPKKRINNYDTESTFRNEEDDFEEEFEPEFVKQNNKPLEPIKLDKISTIINKAKERIVGQDAQVKEVITAIYKNRIFKDPRAKSSILVYGPSGCGKTELVRTIGEIINIPITIEDCTRYTSAGYEGNSIDDVLKNVYFNCNNNLELAQQSILVLDEIDKKAEKDPRDSFTKGDVLKSLLKLIEGAKYDVKINQFEKINFDTSKLTIICCGAFADLEETKTTNSIGFTNVKSNLSKLAESKEEEKLIKYGMPVEFMGRMNTIVKFNELKEKELINILKQSTLSPLKSYEETIKELGIDILLDDDIYKAIATKAIELKTGARSLKKIVDSMFHEILYDIFDSEENEITKIEITDQVVNDSHSYKLIKKEM